MKYKISYEKRALLELRKMDKLLAIRIIKKIKELEDDPFSKDIKRLKGQTSFRLRIGDYRVLFELFEEEIKILKIGHRKNIYEF
ncbi:type II toxin-antitoxin system RelE/ParE family toxin [Candidatus Pacearchaeota archaeon]|nr:type II toxin-antitoxin system RelE/ParE family toxin [Candidatus Pacearchaeota archaeon]